MQIGYARVSTIDQDPALQIAALTQAGCERIFTEHTSSAKERPELRLALDIARDGDVLTVWKLDRLARSTKELIATVETLAARGIGLKCLTQPIDTTTAGGRLVFTIFAAFAEFERDLIRERTHAGLKAARARGRKGGRPSAMTEKDIAGARAMLADHSLSPSDVAKRFGVSRATLYRHVQQGKDAA